MLLERLRRGRADGGDRRPRRHAAVLGAARQVAGEHAHGVGAGEHHELVGGELTQDGRDLVVQGSRLDADGGHHEHLGAERLKRTRERLRLLARPGHDDRAPGQRPVRRGRRVRTGRAHSERISSRMSPAPRSSSSAARKIPEALRVAGEPHALAAHGARAVERAYVGGKHQRAGAALAVDLPVGVRGDGHLAASLQGAEERSLRLDGARRRRVVERRHELREPRVVGPGLDRQGALTHGRQHLVEREREPGHLGAAETGEPRGREDRARHLLLDQLAQAGLHVAADVHHVEVGSQRQELRAAPQARGAHACALRYAGQSQLGAGLEPLQQGRIGHEHVAHVLALGEGDDVQPLGDRRRHVLGRVHGHVDAVLEQRGLELLGEQSLVADLGQRRVEDLVALGVDDLDLHAQVRVALRHAVAHPLRLHESEAGAAGADADQVTERCSSGAPLDSPPAVAIHTSSVPVPRS